MDLQAAAPSGVERVASIELALGSKLAVLLQREVSRFTAPMWMPSAVGVLWLGFGYEVVGMERLRARYRQLRNQSDAPLLICANHLTMIDSAIIAWALGSPGWYLLNYSAIPWNLPERRNFAYSPVSEILSYLMKCLPVTRGGERTAVADVLNRFVYLLSQGEVGMIFPEGGRSRSGRVEVDTAAPGVGRVVTALPGCRVLCVYLRGERQETFGTAPVRGERLHLRMKLMQPRSRHSGLRGSRDVAQQIVAKLAEMEKDYFDGRKRRRGSRGQRNRTRSHASAV
jgi:1-acyl-sn-glycerol-3-phosphate acyltransferase